MFLFKAVGSQQIFGVMRVKLKGDDLLIELLTDDKNKIIKGFGVHNFMHLQNELLQNRSDRYAIPFIDWRIYNIEDYDDTLDEDIDEDWEESSRG